MADYEYMSFNQVADCPTNELMALTNDQIANQITLAMAKAMQTLRDQNLHGWEMVSHSVQFFSDRLAISLLLRRPR